tara:strand:- start:272 stop:658 length:387 start_codon:yes stop_codon:yes gene_type:complete
MKTIKLIVLSLFMSYFSYSQDTLQQMISGDNHLIFNHPPTKILYQANEFDEGNYQDIEIDLDPNQVLQLGLYDNCKKCLNKDIKSRDLIIYFRNGKKDTYKVKSDDNFIIINGDVIKSLTVLKPQLNG